jgi:hypothetical protein
MANIPLLVDNAKRQTTFKRLVAPTLRIRAVSWPRVVPLSFFLVELMLDVPEADYEDNAAPWFGSVACRRRCALLARLAQGVETA